MVVQTNLKEKPQIPRGRPKSPASVTFGENANKRQKASQSVTRQVTVDTSRARSNADVVKTCVEQLGWKEVNETYSTPVEFFKVNFYSALMVEKMVNLATFIGTPSFIRI